MAIKEHDFVEIEYTGKVNDAIFDTTSEDVAKKNDVFDPKAKYKPLIICVGEQHVVPGLDQSLIGKEAGKSYTITLQPEQAFGKKDAKKIRLVPLRTFQKQKIMPQPGLQVDIDGQIATVLRAGGGRILVDFNHPLASKEVTYEVTIKRQITDPEEKIKSYLSLAFPIPIEVKVVDNDATITMQQELPNEFTDQLSKKLTELTGVKKVEFKAKKEDKNNTTPE